jgi:hypothetical protein
MTHDELVKKILSKMETEMFNDTWGSYATGDSSLSRALFKVVELHTPSPIPDWVPTKEELMCWCAHVYPCPTIQAIKKELA